MSLSLVNLPDLHEEIRRLKNDLFTRNRQLNEAEEALRQEKQKTAAIEVGVMQLRTVLNPLYKGLQHIFGEIDEIGISDPIATSSGIDPRKAAAWEDWKRKLGGQAAKAIDALLLHGALTQSQIRLHVGCATGSTAGIVYQLNKAGLINKNGGRISLKEL